MDAQAVAPLVLHVLTALARSHSALPQTNTFNFFMLLWILGGYRLAVFLTMRIYSKLFGKSRAMDDPSKWVHQQLRRRVFPVIIILFLACSIPLANTGLGKNVFQHLKVGVNTRGDALERAWGRYQIGRQGTDEFIYLSQTYGAIQLEQARREYNRYALRLSWPSATNLFASPQVRRRRSLERPRARRVAHLYQPQSGSLCHSRGLHDTGKRPGSW